MESIRVETKIHDKKLYTFVFCNVDNEIVAWYTYDNGQLEIKEVNGCPHFKVVGNKIIEVSEGTQEQLTEVYFDIEENRS